MDMLRSLRSRSTWLVSTSLFIGAGCGVTGPSSRAVIIDMSVTAFTRLPSTEAAVIPFQLRNHDSVTVYVPGCCSHPVLGLEQLTSLGWQDLPPVLGCICNPALIALMPGAVLADSQRCAHVGRLRLTVSYGLDASQPLNMVATGPTFTVR